MKKIYIILFLLSINVFTVYGDDFNLNAPVKDAGTNYQTDLPNVSKTTTGDGTESKLNDGTGPTIKNAENSNGGPTTVVVSEKIPWADCTGDDNQPIESRKFKCTVKPGFGSVMQMFAGLVKYTTFLAALVGVLMIAVAGIRLSISGIESGEKAKAKEMIEKVIFSLILLFLIGFILNSVAPWVYN